jgi:hypothetical protein
MSIPGRIFKISKTYLNQVRDRIDAELTERESATRELEGEAGSGAGRTNDAESLMRRAEEKIAAARRELDARREASGVPASDPTASTRASAADPNASDYRILGVAIGSDLSTVQGAYEKLAARCDPRRFPDGSGEKQDAERILVRVNAAYEALQKRLDPMQNRFGKLELE